MQDVLTIKDAIIPIAKQYGLKRIYLFGSYAKGTANENSDIDLLIEKGKSLSLLMLSGFRQDVEDLLELSVDVVTTSSIAGELKKEIDETKILLYEEK